MFDASKRLEELIHRGLEPDGHSVVLGSQDELNQLVSIAHEANVEGAAKLETLVSAHEPEKPFQFDLTRDNWHHTESAEEQKESEMSLMSQMVVAATSHMLTQLEAKEGAVKTLEEGVDSNLLNKENENPQQNKEPQQAQSKQSLLQQALNPKPKPKNDPSLENELQGSDNMAAMQQVNQQNAILDETVASGEVGIATGQEDNRGGNQENSERNSAFRTPSPFSTKPEPR